MEIPENEISPDDCLHNGTVYPEHDYDEYECRRCYAEAPVNEESDSANAKIDIHTGWANDKASHALEEALDQIALMFVQYVGRMPSRMELREAVEDTMESMMLAESVEDTPRATEPQWNFAKTLGRMALSDRTGLSFLAEKRGELLDDLRDLRGH